MVKALRCFLESPRQHLFSHSTRFRMVIRTIENGRSQTGWKLWELGFCAAKTDEEYLVLSVFVFLVFVPFVFRANARFFRELCDSVMGVCFYYGRCQ